MLSTTACQTIFAKDLAILTNSRASVLRCIGQLLGCSNTLWESGVIDIAGKANTTADGVRGSRATRVVRVGLAECETSTMLSSTARQTISAEDLAILANSRASVLHCIGQLLGDARGNARCVVNLATEASSTADGIVGSRAAGVVRVDLAECETSTMLRTTACQTIAAEDLAILTNSRASVLHC